MTDLFIGIYPYVVCALLLYALIVALRRYFVGALNPAEAPASKPSAPAFAVLRTILIAFVLSRALIWTVAYVGNALSGSLDTYLNNQLFVWTQWDAPHYLGIAENGYVTEGDARLHIVFYPLYPYLVRGLHAVIPLLSITAWAFIVSNAALLGAAYVLFRLAEGTYGSRCARRAVWLFLFCPTGMFFSIPYTESIFLLCTLLSVLSARKQRFLCALLFGALASFSRLPGAVCAVPLYYELIRAARRRGDGKAHALLMSALKCLPILSGFAAYMIINAVVTGNPFQFLIYQRGHWGQSAGSVFRTARYTAYYLVYPNVDWYRWGVWIPQSAFLLLSAVMLALSARRLNVPDLAYALVYENVVISPTMLISGPRYLCAMYPAYLILARIRRRWARALVYALLAALYMYCVWMYTVNRILL